MDHLDDNAIAEFVSGDLPPGRLARVEGHLAGCRDCRALVAALAQDDAADSHGATIPHERLSPSQVTQLPTRPLTVGDRVGRYLVLSTLGTGGMGVVFAAYDPQLDRKVALKLLRSGTNLPTQDATKRLRREAQAIAQLSHPHVVGVYDVGTTDDGHLYIAMEFVEGDTLTAWLKRWPRTWREIVDVFLQAGRGLVAAHSVGLLHRDFKPDNVLVGGDGRVRVTDFGLARSLVFHLDEESARGPTPSLPLALSSPLTATGTVLGTPRYMPPEQLTGPDIDARADQFSFCVALHEALYGAHPLPGGTSVAMLEQGVRATPPPSDTRVPALVGRAVARGLERDRTKRFPTMASLISELTPPPPSLGRKSLALAIGGIVVVGGVATAMIVTQEEPVPLGPADGAGVQPFVDQINELKSNITAIDRERRTLISELERRAVTQDEVVMLRRQLADKDTQIQALVQQVTILQTQTGRLRRDRVTTAPSQVAQAIGALGAANTSIDYCLDEWIERARKIETPEGWRTPDVDVVLRLAVAGDGTAHSADATMRTSADHLCPVHEPRCNESPSLALCLEAAVTRTRFPAGPEQLDLELAVGWSQGLRSVSPRVLGRRAAAGTTIDLE